ncbi:thermonuclease family protein [Methylobacterium sp. 092160098-2]|uniref:thermonuclease family protein n=1 Tax=Methylobacterium sp. 092160098-2 TaxID=3025129 RepID=UPI002381A0AD|nr:thermonuclease family protein [Methylobacterium sp. 092160098-2]MDE4914892.1 thermonuclease family protein [Methylobacterium sp. 092160098-2]
MRAAFLLTLTVLTPLQASPAAAWRDAPDEIVGRASVVDGDTIEVRGVRIRLAGVDAPESDQTCSRGDGTTYRCGQASALFLDRMLEGRTVSCRGRGVSYDRIVAECDVGGVDVSSAMVAAGWAVDYPRYSRGRYAADQAGARGRRDGVWQGDFVRPDVWRHSGGRGRP